MLDTLRIEALAHGCARCGSVFSATHRVLAAYHVKALRSFATQVELGLLGGGTRNFWTHVDCSDHTLAKGSWDMHPSIHHCIKCKAALNANDIVNPVFQVFDPNMVNPDDPSDKGVSLGDRVYFLHASCKNPRLSNSILITP